MSTPKTPRKDSTQIALERAQINELNKQKATEQAAINKRRADIKRKSIGRTSLIKTSEQGVADLNQPAPVVGG